MEQTVFKCKHNACSYELDPGELDSSAKHVNRSLVHVGAAEAGDSYSKKQTVKVRVYQLGPRFPCRPGVRQLFGRITVEKTHWETSHPDLDECCLC